MPLATPLSDCRPPRPLLSGRAGTRCLAHAPPPPAEELDGLALKLDQSVEGCLDAFDSLVGRGDLALDHLTVGSILGRVYRVEGPI